MLLPRAPRHVTSLSRYLSIAGLYRPNAFACSYTDYTATFIADLLLRPFDFADSGHTVILTHTAALLLIWLIFLLYFTFDCRYISRLADMSSPQIYFIFWHYRISPLLITALFLALIFSFRRRQAGRRFRQLIIVTKCHSRLVTSPLDATTHYFVGQVYITSFYMIIDISQFIAKAAYGLCM
jgi:hypothetical protein